MEIEKSHSSFSNPTHHGLIFVVAIFFSEGRMKRRGMPNHGFEEFSE